MVGTASPNGAGSLRGAGSPDGASRSNGGLPSTLRPALTFGAIGLALTILYMSVGSWPVPAVALVSLGALAVLSNPLGVQLNRPVRPAPWLGLAVAIALMAAGAGLAVADRTLGNLTQARPTGSDVVTLFGYLLLAASATALTRTSKQGDHEDTDVFFDSALVALGVFSLTWAYVVAPRLDVRHVPLVALIALVSRPAIDAYVLAIVVLGTTGTGRTGVAARWMRWAIAALGAGDLIYQMAEVHLVDPSFRTLGIPFMLSATAFGMAALHPTMARLSRCYKAVESRRSATVRPDHRYLPLVLAAPGASVFALTVGHRSSSQRETLGIIALLALGLAGLRVWRAVRSSAGLEDRLVHRWAHDALTGSANRARADEWWTDMLGGSVQSRFAVAAILFDVDRFKLVNDRHGWAYGDELLVQVARRLESAVGSSDLVARIAGDEFVVLLPHVDTADQARREAERIHSQFAPVFEVHGAQLKITASAGVALRSAGEPVGDVETLIRDADTAMYQAKEAGRDTVTTFDASMRDRIADRLAMERDLKVAIEREEFCLVYQPMVTLDELGTMVVGLEALLRWDRPTRGLVPASVFVATAESSGLLVEIGEWAIREACRQVALWRSTPGAERLFVSVNVSALQMKNASLPSRLRGALAESGVPADALCVEIAEPVLTDQPAEAAVFLLRLKEIGVRLAVDDFGTGYSSLAYLKQFPVDYVKMDRSFVDGLTLPDPVEETLVAAIVSMAQALGVITIAKGVENELQEEALRSLETDMAQGYLYSRPVPPEKVMDVVRALSPRRGLRLVIGDAGAS